MGKKCFNVNHLQEEDKLEESAQKLKDTIRNTFPTEAKMED